jgi:hypothetical protein
MNDISDNLETLETLELYGKVFTNHSRDMREALTKLERGEISKKEASDVCLLGASAMHESFKVSNLSHFFLVKLIGKFAKKFEGV